MADLPNDTSAESSDREGVSAPHLHKCGQPLIVLQETFEDAQDITTPPQSRPSSSTNRSLTNADPSSTVSTPRAPPDKQRTEELSNPERMSQEKDVDPEKQDLPAKSPLLISHRVSASSMDNVQLDGANEDRPFDSTATVPNGKTSTNPSPRNSQGLSGNLPSMPWSQSSGRKASASATSPAPPPRKLGMSFSWLSRSSSANKDTSMPSGPPTTHDRRNTVTSMASINSNPELMLSKLDEGNESDASTAAKIQRNSLRERFKMLRLREEAGIQSLEGQELDSPTSGGGAIAGLIGRSASMGIGIASPSSVADEKEGGLTRSPMTSPVTAVPPTNNELAPGTVSGVSAGPSAMADPAAPVDWDLWQSVVYEGPSAVARTSAEELAVAIASGIPSAIRGVVWQVLAQSKNEELETIYRDLCVRGTDKDLDNMNTANGQQAAASMMNGGAKEKQSIKSSTSSMHSGHSTPATTATNGMSSPSVSQQEESENVKQLQAAMLSERKKKAKDDAAALQKLEKVIRKDLGARTSYSKYAVAAGLQEPLFGVCKAYALFDEGVGYAQGMNFLIMPLLFNVGYSISPPQQHGLD